MFTFENELLSESTGIRGLELDHVHLKVLQNAVPGFDIHFWYAEWRSVVLVRAQSAVTVVQFVAIRPFPSIVMRSVSMSAGNDTL